MDGEAGEWVHGSPKKSIFQETKKKKTEKSSGKFGSDLVKLVDYKFITQQNNKVLFLCVNISFSLRGSKFGNDFNIDITRKRREYRKREKVSKYWTIIAQLCKRNLISFFKAWILSRINHYLLFLIPSYEYIQFKRDPSFSIICQVFKNHVSLTWIVTLIPL